MHFKQPPFCLAIRQFWSAYRVHMPISFMIIDFLHTKHFLLFIKWLSLLSSYSLVDSQIMQLDSTNLLWVYATNSPPPPLVVPNKVHSSIFIIPASMHPVNPGTCPVMHCLHLGKSLNNSKHTSVGSSVNNLGKHFYSLLSGSVNK